MININVACNSNNRCSNFSESMKRNSTIIIYSKREKESEHWAMNEHWTTNYRMNENKIKNSWKTFEKMFRFSVKPLQRVITIVCNLTFSARIRNNNVKMGSLLMLFHFHIDAFSLCTHVILSWCITSSLYLCLWTLNIEQSSEWKRKRRYFYWQFVFSYMKNEDRIWLNYTI